MTLARWYGDRDRRIEYVSGDALWYHTGFVPVPIRWVLIRDPLGKFATQALLCTDQEADPVQILLWFARRWQMEVTFHEVRAHLGVETQRQWSERAIARTTPALMGLFSLVTLLAHEHYRHQTTASSAGACCCLVYENHADLQRCAGAGSSPSVDPDDFSHITS